MVVDALVVGGEEREGRQTELKHQATDKAKQREDPKLTFLGKINPPSCCPQWLRIFSFSLLLDTDERSPTQNSLDRTETIA